MVKPFKGMYYPQLLSSFLGTNYDVKVPPGENLIVLLRQSSPFGYNLSFSYSSTIVFTTDALKRQVKERGNRIARRDPRLNVVCKVNFLIHLTNRSYKFTSIH